jgi:hypothetical protein
MDFIFFIIFGGILYLAYFIILLQHILPTTTPIQKESNMQFNPLKPSGSSVYEFCIILGLNGDYFLKQY